MYPNTIQRRINGLRLQQPSETLIGSEGTGCCAQDPCFRKAVRGKVMGRSFGRRVCTQAGGSSSHLSCSTSLHVERKDRVLPGESERDSRTIAGTGDGDRS